MQSSSPPEVEWMRGWVANWPRAVLVDSEQWMPLALGLEFAGTISLRILTAKNAIGYLINAGPVVLAEMSHGDRTGGPIDPHDRWCGRVSPQSPRALGHLSCSGATGLS